MVNKQKCWVLVLIFICWPNEDLSPIAIISGNLPAQLGGTPPGSFRLPPFGYSLVLVFLEIVSQLLVREAAIISHHQPPDPTTEAAPPKCRTKTGEQHQVKPCKVIGHALVLRFHILRRWRLLWWNRGEIVVNCWLAQLITITGGWPLVTQSSLKPLLLSTIAIHGG